jgi:hypothetical protein
LLFLFPILRRLAVLAIVLAIPLVAGELVARKLLGDAVRSAVVARIGGSAQISFGSTPVLWQLVHGHLNVSVTAARVDFRGLPPVSLRGQLDDIHLTSLTSLQGAIGAVTVEAKLGPDGVRDLLSSPRCIDSLPSSLAAALTARPRVLIFPGHVSLLPPVGRSAELRLRPRALGGSVDFHVIAVVLNSAPVAPSTLDAVAAQADCVRQLGDLPFGLRLAHAGAGSGAVTLGFAASDSSFSAAG